MQERYDKAMLEAQRAIDSGSGTKYELYYLKALSELKLKKFADSRRTFGYILERYPGCVRAFDSYIGIGDAYFFEGNTSAALRAYRTAAEEFGDDKNVAVARQRMTDCLARSGSPAPEARPPSRPAEPAPLRARDGYARKETVNFTPKSKSYAGQDKDVRIAPPSEKRGYFSVQVGSFKNRSNAQKLASKLSKRRYEVRVETSAETAGRLYRVRVGRLPSGEDAEKLARNLKREGYPTRVCQED